MANVTLHAHSDPDGILRLAVPVGVPDAEYDVQVTLSPAQQPTPQPTKAATMTPEQWREWREFIAQTAGSLADDPIERPAQGDYEQRDAIE